MLKLEVVAEGLLNAVAFWFDLHLDDCETLTNGAGTHSLPHPAAMPFRTSELAHHCVGSVLVDCAPSCVQRAAVCRCPPPLTRRPQ